MNQQNPESVYDSLSEDEKKNKLLRIIIEEMQEKPKNSGKSRKCTDLPELLQENCQTKSFSCHG